MLSNYYVYGRNVVPDMVFKIDHVSSGNFFERHILDNREVYIYYCKFMDGRIVPFTKSDIGRCRQLTQEEIDIIKVELL